MKPLKARKAAREIKTNKYTKISLITQIIRTIKRNTKRESSNISDACMNRDSLASVIEY